MLIENHTCSFKKMHLKMSSAKWRPFGRGLNVLNMSSDDKMLFKKKLIIRFIWQICLDCRAIPLLPTGLGREQESGFSMLPNLVTCTHHIKWYDYNPYQLLIGGVSLIATAGAYIWPAEKLIYIRLNVAEQVSECTRMTNGLHQFHWHTW